MLFKRRKKIFEVVCYEEGKGDISIDGKSKSTELQFMIIHYAILQNALEKAFDTDPDFGHQMAHDIMLVVHAALEERMEDPRDL